MRHKTFFKQIEKIIKEKSMLKHPYYRVWQKGELTKKELQEYAKQYYYLEQLFPQCMSSIHAHCGDADTRQTILKNLNGEELGKDNHMGQFMDFCKGLGVSSAEIKKTPANKRTREFVKTFSNLAQDPDIVKGLAMMVAYKQQISGVGKTKVEGLKEFYNITDRKSLKFFRTHLRVDRSWHKMLDARVTEKNKEKILRSVRKTCDALLTFLDGVTTPAILARATA